jgi:hypothetical protein
MQPSCRAGRIAARRGDKRNRCASFFARDAIVMQSMRDIDVCLVFLFLVSAARPRRLSCLRWRTAIIVNGDKGMDASFEGAACPKLVRASAVMWHCVAPAMRSFRDRHAYIDAINKKGRPEPPRRGVGGAWGNSD